MRTNNSPLLVIIIQYANPVSCDCIMPRAPLPNLDGGKFVAIFNSCQASGIDIDTATIISHNNPHWCHCITPSTTLSVVVASAHAAANLLYI